MSQTVRAFIVGYTGETGKELVKALASDVRFEKVILIGRREVQVDFGSNAQNADARFEQKVVDFANLDASRDVFASNLDIGYCCLGTTRGKSGVAGFRTVDHDYVMKVAENALSCGCKQFHYVSSHGANPDSRLLYLQVKGQVETNLRQCGFPRLVIYRPKALLCKREEARPMEALMRACIRPIAAIAPTWLSTPTTVLARAMANAPFLLGDEPRSHILYNTDIFRLAENGHSGHE